MPFFVYLLECRDKTYYCGWATDSKKRLKAHNKGKASKYTKPRRPVTLVYQEACKSKSQAMKREAEIKSWSRLQKKALINGSRRMMS